jgi:DNA polymerase-3 subunit gamma/tau
MPGTAVSAPTPTPAPTPALAPPPTPTPISAAHQSQVIVQPAAEPLASPLASQVAPALLRLASDDSGSRMTLQLAPQSLGGVTIAVERPQNGKVQVTLTVERQETLALLQQDSAQLAHALDRAGLGAEGRDIAFHLAPPADNPPAGGGAGGGSSGGVTGTPHDGAGLASASGWNAGSHPGSQQGTGSGTHPDANPTMAGSGQGGASGGGGTGDPRHNTASRSIVFGVPDDEPAAETSALASPQPAASSPGLNITA